MALSPGARLREVRSRVRLMLEEGGVTEEAVTVRVQVSDFEVSASDVARMVTVPAGVLEGTETEPLLLTVTGEDLGETDHLTDWSASSG